MKGCAIGCGVVVLLAGVAVGVAVWKGPELVQTFFAKEGERQAAVKQWSLPAKDAPDDAIFPPEVAGYRRAAIDGSARIAELQIDLPGKHAVYRNGPSQIDVYVYWVSHLEAQALFKRADDASQGGSGTRSWSSVDLGDEYARVYLWSTQLRQNHLWYTRGRLVVFRTADEDDRENFVQTYFKTRPPEVIGPREAKPPVEAKPSANAEAQAPIAAPVVWNLDNLESIGGHKVTVVGTPSIIDTDHGKALAFDGKEDAIYLPVNPLAGLKQFTAEVVFQPAAGGPKEQRFLHFQPDGSEDRVLFETRLPVEGPAAGQWFLDTYLQTGPGKHTLFAEKSLHPLGPWYAAAATVDGAKMRHYVNGVEELAADVNLIPLAAGQTSIGVRFNKVHWFQGAIRTIRVTPRVLEPAEFLKP